MIKKQNLIGIRFGRLEVVERFMSDNKNESMWLCRCDCGNLEVSRASKLKRGKNRCSKCLEKERGTHRMSYSREYKIWNGMRQRCENEKAPAYKYYQQRGIGVCVEWRDFEKFILDMGLAPTRNHTIERINNNEGYSKSNCVWATMKQQSRNKRSNKVIEFNGEKKCIAEWCEEIGIEKRTLCGRLLNGWSAEKALTTPVLHSRKTKTR